VVTLNIGGKPQLALTKTVVAHPIRPYIEHIDLLVISRGEKVVVEVGVTVTGDAAPGSLVTQELNTLEVEADVSSIPEHIEVSVEGLAIGTQVLAGDVRLPEGALLRTDPDALVANVVAAPTEEEMEADLDTEGAGVVEDAPESAEEPAAEDSDS
jgi:large subunit ribosomal protein L25